MKFTARTVLIAIASTLLLAAAPFDAATTEFDLADLAGTDGSYEPETLPDALPFDTMIAEPSFAIADKPVKLAALVDTAVPETLDEQMRCLATAVYFESRGEPLEGQLAVAEVILNRVESGRYAPTVCGVVSQPGQFTYAKRRSPAAGRDWEVAKAIAFIAMHGQVAEIANGAMSFHATHVAPGWGGKRKLAQIGNHIFYR